MTFWESAELNGELLPSVYIFDFNCIT